jgi:hypothetical protein
MLGLTRGEMHERTLIAFFEKGDLRGSSMQMRLLDREPPPEDFREAARRAMAGGAAPKP